MRIEEQSETTLADLFGPLKSAIDKYKAVSWAPALAFFALVCVFAYRLPDYFVADVLIYIQPAKISSKIVEAPAKDDQRERLEALIQEILSRPRLKSLIEQYDLYSEYQGVVGKETALKKFRKAIGIRPITSDTGRPLLQTFRLEFTHFDPKISFEVVKRLSELFIDESIISRRSETQGTEEFLEGQLRDAKKKLEATEQRVSEFVRENFGRLPDHLDQAIARLENAQSQIGSNSRLISANVARLANLEEELSRAKRQPRALDSGGGAAEAGDPYESVQQLEAALVLLRSRYSDRHPDVVSTKKRLESVRAEVAALEKSDQGAAKTAGMEVAGDTPYMRTLRREKGEIEVQTAKLKDENEHLKSTVAALEKDIASMPLKEQELISIKRDYANVQRMHEQLLAARDEARLQSSLVRAQKGTQFRIVEPAALPVIPAGPNRLMITAAGFAAALIVFLGLPVALFFLNGAYKYRNEVESELGLPVLGSIPPMNTPKNRVIQRRAISTSLLASAVVFVVGSGVIFVVL